MIYLIFILGTIFGSFLTLVIDRRIRGESIVYPRSHCYYCGHTLGVLDLLPVLSFVFSKAKCKYCGENLSIFYPIFEIIGGFLTVFTFSLSDSLNEFILFTLGIYLAFVIAIIDFKTMEIFSYQVYILIAIGLIYRYFNIGFDSGFLEFTIIFSLLYLIIYKCFKESIGDGDYYYYIGLILFLKSSYLISFVLFSIWIGALFGIFKIIKYKTSKLKMSFCPYIFISFILVLFLGEFGVLL